MADNFMLVDDMRTAKSLSTRMWDGLLPSERQRALSLLGTYYRAYDSLATYTGLANGRIEQLRDALQRIKSMTDVDNPESHRCDDREGCLDTVFAVAAEALKSSVGKSAPHEVQK